MPLVQITKSAAMKKMVNGNGDLFILKPTGEKARKVLFKLDELFEGCIFLEDVGQDKANEIKRDISDESNQDESDDVKAVDDGAEGGLDERDLKKAPAGRKHRGRIDLDTCKALYKANWSCQQIADEFGVQSTSVRNFINRHISQFQDRY